jgi:hypothetical protein
MSTAAFGAPLRGTESLDGLSFAEMDELARRAWRDVADGRMGETEAQALTDRIANKRQTYAAGAHAAARRMTAPRRLPPRSPDRSKSIRRRRLLAASGPLPPQLAAEFTVSEQSVLRIIGDEALQFGGCRLHVDAIAARAGTCRTVVGNAKRLARRLGLISVQERRCGYRQSKSTVIRVISRVWEAWLRHNRAHAMRQAIAKLESGSGEWVRKTKPSAIEFLKRPAERTSPHHSEDEGQQKRHSEQCAHPRNPIGRGHISKEAVREEEDERGS